MTVFGVVAPKGPLRSHITGGYKDIQTRISRSDLDCSQFSSDYDVLHHFPFFIMINPINNHWNTSLALMNEDGTVVLHLYITNEMAVPLSIFCLQNLEGLQFINTPFSNGIVPDNLENLKHLRELYIYNSPILNMTERLGTLSHLFTLYLQNCSLTYLPNLSEIRGLWNVDLSQNQLSKVDRLTGVRNLDLRNNFFTEIPTMNTPDTLKYLYMDNNPIKNMLAITSHVNLRLVSLSNATVSSVPATIDRLQKLEELDLSFNKLFFLPTNMLKLVKLQTLNIQNNSFSFADIEKFQTEFSNSLPNMALIF